MIPDTFDPKYYCRQLTSQPGIYQMFAEDGELLYVGKAKNLKKRVSSYFRQQTNSAKIDLLVTLIHHIEVITTQSETEALLLENILIKKHHPRFNVCLRDDKGYPYIVVSGHPDYPRIDIYRGKKNKSDRYYGPYPSAMAVHETLNLLQRVFLIRSCKDSFFQVRTRPCLQYQIKRCTAPCVKFISPEDYQQSVRHAELFLEGRNQEIIDTLTRKMEQASVDLAYEEAAVLRDQIKSLRQIQRQQIIEGDGGDLDVLAVVEQQHHFCVNVMTIRSGRIIGNKSHFLKAPASTDQQTVLTAFISQYYLNDLRLQQMPKEILVNEKLEEQSLLNDMLNQQAARKTQIKHAVRGNRAKWITMTQRNAELALSGHLSSQATVYRRFEKLMQVLHLENLPQRIECFDISHTMGEKTVASCVVFNIEGPLKSDYRRFNITGITPGDDYAAMRQAIQRRYMSVKTNEGVLPDILLIDGGKGQLLQAEEILEELQISGVTVIGVAKGPDRKAGLESLILAHSHIELDVPTDSPARHLIQQVRDEAHRFAITGHRQQRGKQRKTSRLEDIEGIGPKRRQVLLKHFGGIQELIKASVDEIAQVHGVSRRLAQSIYDGLHD